MSSLFSIPVVFIKINYHAYAFYSIEKMDNTYKSSLAFNSDKLFSVATKNSQTQLKYKITLKLEIVVWNYNLYEN